MTEQKYATELKIYSEKISDVMYDEKFMEQIRSSVESGHIVVFKNAETSKNIENLKRYCFNILCSTLEVFAPIKQGCTNYVRFSQSDARANTPLFCNSVSFFPWNRDLFNLFELYGDFYRFKNIIAGAHPERYLSKRVESGATSRIAMHFYPEGRGYLGCHTDPIGNHQEVTATLLVDPGVSRGYYVLKDKDTKWYFEGDLEVGDFYIGSPIIPHGVDLIGDRVDYDPMSPNGRWSLLFPVNKTVDNEKISDSVNIKMAT